MPAVDPTLYFHSRVSDFLIERNLIRLHRPVRISLELAVNHLPLLFNILDQIAGSCHRCWIVLKFVELAKQELANFGARVGNETKI